MLLDRRSLLKSAAVMSLAGPAVIRPAFADAGGTVRWLTAEPTTGNWDPSANTTLANVQVENLAFEPLLAFPMIPGPDVLKPRPVLAEKFTIVDPQTVDIEIRKGVRFHDGSELTAEDVKASLDYYSRPKIARAFYGGPLRVTIKGPTSLTVNTADAAVTSHKFMFLQFFAPILSAKDIANPNVLQTNLNGTGPFRYLGTQNGAHRFEVFAGYWGSIKPKMAQLVVRHVPDSNARVLALLSGEAELIERLEPEQYESLKQKPRIATSKVASLENKYLHFRNNKKPFDDWRVRRAAAAAIDRDAILSIVGDAGYAADCLLPPMKLGYVPQPDYGKFDPALCQKLLAEAGYPKGAGMPELEYITSSGFYPKSKEYCEAVAAMLQAQGFPVKLTVMEVAAWNDRYYNPSAGHMIDGGWSPATPEPDVQLVLQYFSKVGLITAANDPEIDPVLIKEMAAPTIEERKKILQTETLPVIANKLPNLVLFNSNMLHAHSDRLKGAIMSPAALIDFTQAEMS
ncbi:peptide/nickel transport system substrate-binding protein [Bradyrhizobium sp. USDA 4369]